VTRLPGRVLQAFVGAMDALDDLPTARVESAYLRPVDLVGWPVPAPSAA
jgi:hypothetical protein